MVRRDTGEMIGDCGLTMQRIHGVIRPEIEYHVRRDCQRQGTRRRRRAPSGTGRSSIRPLYSYMKKANIASSASARACGMRFAEKYPDEEGEVTAVYMISRAEWEKRSV